jgi:general secretion pathway protein A
MYENHFGFKLKPFQAIPNPEFFYMSPKHENALTYLEYGLMERTGFILLTGEIGSGKTTLIKYLLNKIEKDIDVAVIFNTNITAEQLIDMILNEFELSSSKGSKAQALDTLYQFLVKKFSKKKHVLLIIDEAQNLSRDVLEEVRMLSNLQSEDQMLIQIMLVGQPELSIKLKRPNLNQLNQRITVAYHINALTREETEEYINFRLSKAGGKPGLFTKEAIDLIHETSGGIPRTINIICETALVYGFADDLTEITKEVILQVIDDRKGMGLAYNPGIDQDHMENKSAFLKRMEQLEHSLSKLQISMETRIGETEKTAQGYRDELIAQLKERFSFEQKKNERIAIEFAKLKEKYIALLGKQKELALSQSSNSPPFPATDGTSGVDNQTRMNEPVNVAPKKSQARKDRKKPTAKSGA